MLERITNDAFFDEIRSVGPGDVAHHSMLFPGVYPSDRDSHELAKQGQTFEPTSPFYDAARTALTNGGRLEWLRVLPRPGEFGCDQQDIQAIRRTMGVIASFGFDVRTITYNDHAARIMAYCEDSPIAQDYVQGLEDGMPRKSSWAIFKRYQTGRLVLRYLDTMDYEDGKFLGHVRHSLPVNEHVARWTFCWRDTYENHAQPLNPLS